MLNLCLSILLTRCHYLVDAGYTNCKGFLAPFRGQRYHLKEWEDGTQPRNAQEYYNMKHSHARNVIEICFGVLKSRWAILRSPSFFPIKTQNRIILACCLLHNFIRHEMPNDVPDPIPEDECENVEEDEEQEDNDDLITAVEPSEEWTGWRNTVAQDMFNDWRNRRNA